LYDTTAYVCVTAADGYRTVLQLHTRLESGPTIVVRDRLGCSKSVTAALITSFRVCRWRIESVGINTLLMCSAWTRR